MATGTIKNAEYYTSGDVIELSDSSLPTFLISFAGNASTLIYIMNTGKKIPANANFTFTYTSLAWARGNGQQLTISAISCNRLGENAFEFDTTVSGATAWAIYAVALFGGKITFS